MFIIASCVSYQMYPPGGGAYPPVGGAYPPASGAYPPGGGAYPPGGGGYPTAGGFPPVGDPGYGFGAPPAGMSSINHLIIASLHDTPL